MLHRHAGPAVAGSYALGAVTGALTTAAALLVVNGLLSPIPATLRATAAIAVVVLLGLRASGLLCLDLPQRKHQIPRETFTHRPRQSAFRFAFELGTGVRTYITTTAPYAAAVVLALALPTTPLAAVVAAAAAGLGYGLGRSLVVITQSVRTAVAVEPPQRWLRSADMIAVAGALAIAIAALV